MDTSGKAPLSSHPAFKWIVGLWFAALLGLGIFVMPGALHDLISQRTGLASLTPLAEPPVGTAGRLLVSSIAALLGFLLGLAIAQRAARAHALEDFSERDEDYHEPEPAPAGEEVVVAAQADTTPTHRVFNPREELDEAGIEGVPPLGTAVEESALPHDQANPPSLPEREDALVEDWRDDVIATDDFLPEQTDAGQNDNFTEPEVVEALDPVFDASAEPQSVGPALDIPASSVEAPGDMSLSALTERLRRAIAASGSEQAGIHRSGDSFSGNDPYMRTQHGAQSFVQGEDPQSVLRSALEKLSRVSNPK